jgi:hypothetical protein
LFNPCFSCVGLVTFKMFNPFSLTTLAAAAARAAAALSRSCSRSWLHPARSQRPARRQPACSPPIWTPARQRQWQRRIWRWRCRRQGWPRQPTWRGDWRRCRARLRHTSRWRRWWHYGSGAEPA